MKNIMLALCVLFTTQANATLIEFDLTQANYNSGESFNVLVSIDNTAGNIEEIDFSLDYDFTSLIFDSFSFDFDNTWSAITFADEFALGTIEGFSWWPFQDAPTGIFTLGYATFEVADLGAASYMADKSAFNLVMNNVVTAEVPEPPAILILLLGLGLLLATKMKSRGAA